MHPGFEFHPSPAVVPPENPDTCTQIAFGILQYGMLAVLAYLLTAGTLGMARAQDGHPPEHMQLHEQFYRDWTRTDFADNPSCCNKNDCFPTPMLQRKSDGTWWALRQHVALELERKVARGENPALPPLPPEGSALWDLQIPWVQVPETAFEHNSMRVDLGVKFPRESRPSPDGRSHACINNNQVICAVLGAGN